MSDERRPVAAWRSEPDGPSRPHGFGELVLGNLLDLAGELPLQLVAPLFVDTAARLGGRALSILLQDYGQSALVPLPGLGPAAGTCEPINGTAAGAAFLRGTSVEVPQADGVRIYLPLSASRNEIGVIALTMDVVDDETRGLLHRFASLVAHLLLAGNACTDRLVQARRLEPMSIAAEIQWSLLPPLSMSVPRVAVAGILEPAYAVAGDSFDYALNDDLLHVATIDAMGHGLDAATMATVAIGAYRHARRADVGLADIYSFMDRAVAEQFGPDHFVTAQMMRLDTGSGHLEWVNAGHPAPLLVRDRVVVGRLAGAPTLPVGFGGEAPVISERDLRHGDQILCFTDGLVEERGTGGEQFGEEQLIEAVNQVGRSENSVRSIVRALSHSLKQKRAGRTSDDATLFLIEWR